MPLWVITSLCPEPHLLFRLLGGWHWLSWPRIKREVSLLAQPQKVSQSIIFILFFFWWGGSFFVRMNIQEHFLTSLTSLTVFSIISSITLCAKPLKCILICPTNKVSCKCSYKEQKRSRSEGNQELFWHSVWAGLGGDSWGSVWYGYFPQQDQASIII